MRAWPHRWIGFVFALAVASITTLVVIVLPDTYSSTARLYINGELILKPLLRGLTVEQSSEDNSSVDSKMLRAFQLTLLNDRNIDVLVRSPGIGFDGATVSGRSAGAKVIRSGVTVVEEEPNLFTLTVADTVPDRTFKVAQGLISIFVETSVKRSQADLQMARTFLDKQVAEYEEKLRQIEGRISEFQYKNAGSLDEVTYQVRLKTALTALRDAQLAQKIATETRDRIREQLSGRTQSSGTTQSVLIATDQTFPALIDRMGALQTQLNQLLLQYTDKHPDVIATRREISLLSEQYGLSENIASAAKPFTALPGQVPPGNAVNSAFGQNGALNVAGPSNLAPAGAMPASLPSSGGKQLASLSSAQTQLLQVTFAVMDANRKVESAQAALKVIEAYSSSAPTAETELEQLTRDRTLLKENYEQLLRRRESARIMNAADVSSGTDQFRIIQSPSLPASPTGPDRKTFLLLGSLLSVAAGAALAYALGLIRGTFVSATEAESVLGLPVIAQLTNRKGVLMQVSRSFDAMMLLAGVAGVFIAAYVLSSLSSQFLSPVRTEIYRFLESDLSHLISRIL